MMNEQTLMLSRDFEPVKLVPWQRALTLLFLGKVEVLEEYARDVKCTSYVIKVPAVVRLLKGFKRYRKPVKFSRVNIYGRDNYQCQYCGKKQSIGDLTYDHVVPRSQGGRTEWTNIVSACSECNSRKANRTPERAGMKLLKKPVQPTELPALVITVSSKDIPDAWRDYLYWTGELESD